MSYGMACKGTMNWKHFYVEGNGFEWLLADILTPSFYVKSDPIIYFDFATFSICWCKNSFKLKCERLQYLTLNSNNKQYDQEKFIIEL